jgi:hypothetical protein
MGNFDLMSHFDIKMVGRSKNDFSRFFWPLPDLLPQKENEGGSKYLGKVVRNGLKTPENNQKKIFSFKYFYQTAYNLGTAGMRHEIYAVGKRNLPILESVHVMKNVW